MSSFCLSAHNIFAHRLKHAAIFGGEKKLWNIKCLFRFTPTLMPETFIIATSQRHITTNVLWSSCKVPVILVKAKVLYMTGHEGPEGE